MNRRTLRRIGHVRFARLILVGLVGLLLSSVCCPIFARMGVQSAGDPDPSSNGYHYASEGQSGVPWVEWWYFRLSAPDGRNFFFAYYIVNPWDTTGVWPNSGAYVIAGMSKIAEGTKVLAWDRYAVDVFSADSSKCNVRIVDDGNSALTDQYNDDKIRMRGSLRPSTTAVKGKISNHEITAITAYTWDLTFTQIGGLEITKSLGIKFFNWLVYMMSARMTVGGVITITTSQTSDSFTIQSSDVGQWKGYQDHNWGNAFPDNWIWGHCIENQFSMVLGGGQLFDGTVQSGRLGLNLTAGYYAYDSFLVFSWMDGDKLSFQFSNWVTYVDSGMYWTVPTHYVFEAYNQGSIFPKYKVNVVADWSSANIERLPLLAALGNSVFNDFEPLGVSIAVSIYKKDSGDQDWVKIDHSDLLSTNGGAEYGTRSTGSGVGGFTIPVDKLGLLAPYIGLSSTVIVGAVATVVYSKHVRRRKKRQ